MKFIPLPVTGAYLIEHELHKDQRGECFESYNSEVFAMCPAYTVWRRQLIARNFVKGTIRGLHYNSDMEKHECKLVRCVRGRSFHVLVNLRKVLKYGQMCNVTLYSTQGQTLLIPPRVAHGYQTLQHHTEIQYLISTAYVPEDAAGVNWASPALSIPWPYRASRISEADRNWPNFQGTL